jgi:hypothetical protein
MQFRGRIEEGKLTLDNPSRFATYLSGITGAVSVSVKPFKEARTDKQNNLYWAYLTEMAKASGHTKEELHDFFKKRFNLKTIEVAGVIDEVGGSTTRMNTAEFTQYVEKVEQFATEHFDLTLNMNEYE